MNLHNSISTRVAVVAGAALAGTIFGCGQAPSTPVTFAQIRPLLKTSCALSSSCHSIATPNQGNLSLTDTDAYCALVGATQGATYRTTAKAQYPHRVVASDKASSFLYKKLTLAGADSGSTTPLGIVMPLNQPLDAASLDLFARWIDGGAQNDSGMAAPAGCN